ncbi:ArsR/SmtB family transcription factor [Alkalibacterium sp. f15]|uniref:ArsR/SmtB family transcription factor n=1 Tax=Alkalibacterium sp. f15 TaxID=3414029 RepID=UPI003BF7F827
MEVHTTTDSLAIFEALASDTRLKIVNLLSEKERNIKELAAELYMSSAIVTRHIKQLEEANIIKTKRLPGKAGSQKICSLAIDQLFIRFPRVLYPEYEQHRTDIKVGHFTDFNVEPTCGLATKNDYVGNLDDPKHFMNADRMDADILWFSKGFVEYKFPNLLTQNERPELLEISLEISSEFPVSNNNWPSDISFYINDVCVGTWTVPGNFSDVRGRQTPNWWPKDNSQYGLLKILRINNKETLIDGESISEVNLSQLDFDQPLMKLKIAVDEDSKHVGGLTLFGKSFGNHNQDIQSTVYYSTHE